MGESWVRAWWLTGHARLGLSVRGPLGSPCAGSSVVQALDITAFLQGTPVLGSSGWVGRMPRDGHRGGGIEAWCSRAMCDATGHAAPPSLRPGDPRSGLVGHSVSLGRHARVVRAKAIRGAGVPWLVVAGHAALAITTPGLHYSPKTRRPRRPDGEGDLDARWCVDADGGRAKERVWAAGTTHCMYEGRGSCCVRLGGLQWACWAGVRGPSVLDRRRRGLLVAVCQEGRRGAVDLCCGLDGLALG